MKVSIFHNITEEDGRLAIFSRTGELRTKPGDELHFIGSLDFRDTTDASTAAELAFEAGNSPADTEAVKEYRSWEVRSLSVGDVVAVEDDETHVVTALSCEPTGWVVVDLTQFNLAGAVIVSLRVENSYEMYEDVTVEIKGVVVPTPPADVDSEEYQEWAQDNIIDPYTGVGHEDGDSWYDVEITASSDPALVGRKFDWGY